MKSKRPATQRLRRPKWKAPLPEHVIDLKAAETLEMVEAFHTELKEVEASHPEVLTNAREENNSLENQVEHLCARARSGEQVAIMEMLLVVTHIISTFEKIATENAEILQFVARKRDRWPMFFSRSPLLTKQNEEIADKIDLAGNIGSSRMSGDTVARVLTIKKSWALQLYNYIHALRTASANLQRHIQALAKGLNRRDSDDEAGTSAEQFCDPSNPMFQLMTNTLFVEDVRRVTQSWPLPVQKYTLPLLDQCVRLPPLSSEQNVIDLWWSVGREILMLNTEGEPEAIDDLYAVGRCQEQHHSGLKLTRTGEYYKPGSVRSNVRGKILTDLAEEFERLARQLMKTQRASTMKTASDELV